MPPAHIRCLQCLTAEQEWRAARPRYNGQNKSIQRGWPSLDAFVYRVYLENGMTIPKAVSVNLRNAGTNFNFFVG